MDEIIFEEISNKDLEVGDNIWNPNDYTNCREFVSEHIIIMIFYFSI